jgi:DNA-binding NtrC family response regulator
VTAKPADQKTTVLLSWVSVNHRAAPLLTALKTAESPCHWHKTAEVFLYWRDVEGGDGDREREAKAETQEKLRFQFKASELKITFIPWRTTQSPTDHEAIRVFVEKELKRVRADHPGKTIVIHLSPGTPAMHAVWLALGSTGFVEDPVELIQTADDRAQASGQAAVKRINFRLDTWLSRYRNSRPGKTQATDDDGHTWDPSTVKSPALRNALEQLQLWAPLRVPVLLLGERGTGKTTLANFLRAMSPYQKTQISGKSSNDWPSVVCGQFRVNPELARSELFGHISGAFTGATKDRKGLLEDADGESLFFDEIADIDRDTQRLLMAALEGRGFRRLGETAVKMSKFRLICATNQPFEKLRDSLLDRDFFDRIAVFVLHVPPLRQCTEDIPEAWRKVLLSAKNSSGIAPNAWESFLQDKQLLSALTNHPLPGNFRDLQRAAYHLLAGLQAGDLNLARQSAIAALGTPQNIDTLSFVSDTASMTAMLPIQDVEKHIRAYEKIWFDAAMGKALGNKSKAAELLGMQRKTFENRLKLQGKIE